MDPIKKIQIKQNDSTYDERNVGADSVDIDVLKTSAGVIIDDPNTQTSDPTKTENLGKVLKNKQDTLTFDNDPSTSSSNPVKSSGIANALAKKLDQVITMPATSAAILNKVVQYVGSGSTYKFGHFYRCVNQSGSYVWEETDVQDAASLNFVGTTAQWNALTLAQKAAYETYDLTDDFAGVGVDASLSTTSQNVVKNSTTSKALGIPEKIGGAASQAYTTGQYLLGANGNVYEVIADISAGNSIIVDTNVKLQNGEGIIGKLNDLIYKLENIL